MEYGITNFKGSRQINTTSHHNTSNDTNTNTSTYTDNTTGCISPEYYGRTYVSFKIIVDVYIVGLLCVLGLLGNTLSVVVLRRMKGSTTPLLLIALAVADSCYLLTCLVFQVGKRNSD